MKQDELEAAIAAVDRALCDDAQLVYDDLANAVRHIVRLRNDLIAETRSGKGDGNQLTRINAILSQVVGAEYPLDGSRRERIEDVRERLTSFRA